MLKLASELSEILSDSSMTIAIGIVVVFGVLLLLTGIFKLFGIVVGGAQKQESKAAAAPAVAPAAAAPIAMPVGNTEPVTTTPSVQNGISEETVAAVSAAVAMMAPAGTQYAVRSIAIK